jgi:dTDP-D-glucose 4,6-dehydratase
VQLLVDFINPSIKPLFGELPDRPFEQVRLANTADTYEKIGWKAKTSMEEGLQKTIAWYEQAPKK